MDRDPAVGAVPDRGADDIAAAHRIAAQVIVQGIAAEDSFLAQMAKLGVTDSTGGTAVVHRVAAHFLVRRFHDNVAAQVGHFPAVEAASQVFVVQGCAEGQLDAVDRLDDSLLGGRSLGVRSGMGLALLPRSTGSLGISGVEFRHVDGGALMVSELFLSWRTDNDNPIFPAVLEVARGYRRKHQARGGRANTP